MKGNFRTWAGLVGLGLGILGMAAVMIALVLVPPLLREAAVQAAESVSDATGQVRTAEAGLESAQQAAESLERTSGQMDRTFENLEAATTGLGEGLQSLSAALAVMPGSNFKKSSEQLGQSAQAFTRLSTQMKESRASAERMAGSSRQLQTGVRGSRRSLDATVSALDAAHDGLKQAGDGLVQGFYAFAALLLLLFVAITALSAGVLSRR